MPVVVDDDSILGKFLANHADISANPTYSSGTAFGEWTVTGFLGCGGSSEVYCVRHSVTGEPAALKVLHRTEGRHKERFRRESEFLKENENEALPRFYGGGLKDSRPYIVMELLEPQTLPSGDGKVARYVCAVAEGLAWLHACGYVHRDIKPRNILFRNGARPVIIDFGLIKEIVHELVQKSDELSIVDGREVGMGTPRYAAPEQFAGGEATPAMDIHALGRLTYECFDGHPPRAWSRIIRRATSSIPGERYQTAWDFIRAVRRRHAFSLMLVVAIVSMLFAGHLFVQGRVSSQFQFPTEDDWSTLPEPNPFPEEWNLMGHDVVLDRPVALHGGKIYRLIGPGSIIADISARVDTTLWMSNCVLHNTSSSGYPSNRIKYVLASDVYLNFSGIDRPAVGIEEYVFAPGGAENIVNKVGSTQKRNDIRFRASTNQNDILLLKQDEYFGRDNNR